MVFFYYILNTDNVKERKINSQLNILFFLILKFEVGVNVRIIL
jgi:hypothetical protein